MPNNYEKNQEAAPAMDEAKNSNISNKKVKPVKKGISVWSMMLTVLLINAVWISAAIFFFIPAYKDAVYVRDSQISEYETQLNELQTNQNNVITEYKKRIDELERQLDEQKSMYDNALKLIEQYSSSKTNTSAGNGSSPQGAPKQ